MSDQVFETVCEVVDIKAKRHTSGNRLEILLSVNYDEELHHEAIKKLYKQVKVHIVEYGEQPELFSDEGEEPMSIEVDSSGHVAVSGLDPEEDRPQEERFEEPPDEYAGVDEDEEDDAG